MQSLLWQETRFLLQNRMAVAVLLLMPLAALAARIGMRAPALPAGEVCYVVYWHEDDWVRRLQLEAEQARAGGLAVEVAPVERFVGPDGTIRYPPGAHSIQLRPLPPGADGKPGWLVWSWHGGTDPSALWPYSRWFFAVTLAHFQDQVRWEERVSALEPTAMLRQEIVGAAAQLVPVSLGQASLALVWGAVFFCGCHLAQASLAEQRQQGVLPSLVLTPTGWSGYAWSKRVFYSCLSLAMAVLLAAILTPQALGRPAFWSGLLGAVVGYIGVAMLIGSTCGGVSAGSAGVFVYAMITGLTLVAGTKMPSIAWLGQLTLEGNLLALWNEGADARGALPSLVLLLVLASAWNALGSIAFRRLRV